MDGLIEGRIVHYVLPNGDHRPAIIVNAWLKVYGDGTVNLQVFTDGSNDLHAYNSEIHSPYFADLAEQIKSGHMWRTSIHYSEGKEPDTWHWIEKA